MERGDYRAHLHWTDWKAGRQLWGQWCHGSATPPECHTATFCQRAAQLFPLSALYQVPPWFIAYSVSLDKLICMLVRLLALYQGLYPKYLSAALFIFAPVRYYCLLSDVSPWETMGCISTVWNIMTLFWRCFDKKIYTKHDTQQILVCSSLLTWVQF